jgi:carbon monoxide dehydrogenase subunit G
VKVQGEYSLPLPQQEAWDLLLDTEVLAHALPGCQSLVPIGPDEYEMKLKMVIGSMKGLFAGKIRLEDRNPPASYRLVVDGNGKLGFVRGSGLLTLEPAGPETRLQYAGEVQDGGLIASVGERMLDMTTKMMIKRFFKALMAEAGGQGEDT